MKTLVIGDLHTKIDLLKQIEKLFDRYDRIVFVGDACDDFGAVQKNNTDILEELVSLAQNLGDKFVWLIGNHDWNYYDGSHCCTGHIFENSEKVKTILKKNKALWDIAFYENKIMYSHAGISIDFLENFLMRSLDWKSQDGETVVKYINQLKDTHGYTSCLNVAGRESGGMSLCPGPLWARPNELHNIPEKYVQVVGHTPVQTISFDGNLIICDTFSTYSNGEPIGDHTLLSIDDEGYKILNLNGEEEICIKHI